MQSVPLANYILRIIIALSATEVTDIDEIFKHLWVSCMYPYTHAKERVRERVVHFVYTTTISGVPMERKQVSFKSPVVTKCPITVPHTGYVNLVVS